MALIILFSLLQTGSLQVFLTENTNKYVNVEIAEKQFVFHSLYDSLARAQHMQKLTWDMQTASIDISHAIDSHVTSADKEEHDFNHKASNTSEEHDPVKQSALNGDVNAASNLCGAHNMGPERIQWCKIASELGDFYAPYYLADEYANGWHVPVDQAAATHWYEVSAERGYSISAIQAGMRYFYGIGVAQDDRQAKKWFNHVLEIGNKEAGYFWLGIIKEFAHNDKEKNFKSIVENYKHALQQDSDNRDLYFRLGYLYAKGLGVTLDLTKSQKFFKKAEELVFSDSPLLGSYYLGMGTGRSSASRPKHDIEAKQIQDAIRLASQKGGYASGENMLGLAYFDGIGVEKDIATSLKWFRIAAMHGYSAAYYNAGVMYMHGIGAEKNLSTAKFWLGRGSDAGDSRATFVLGLLYLNQSKVDDVGTDPDEGIQLIKRAANQGEVEAQNLLAIYYALGRYVPQNINLAEIWWERSKERAAELMRHNKSVYEYNDSK